MGYRMGSRMGSRKRVQKEGSTFCLHPVLSICHAGLLNLEIALSAYREIHSEIDGQKT